jgi:hypothetical protein
MAPQHDEIVKHLEDGFTVAWDTTKRDAAIMKEVRKVVAERSTVLAEIFGTGEPVLVETHSGDEGAVPTHRTARIKSA